MDKPTVYLETTIPSYLVAQPSGDVVVAGHQQTTHDWWRTATVRFELLISELVYREVASGSPDLAQRRVQLIQDFPVLASNSDVDSLVEIYAAELGLSGKALGDVPHLAFAVAYEVDYLVTWNCAHIANAIVVRRLRDINERRGLWTPIVCTPEELTADPSE